MMKKYVAEFIGTFVLVLFGCGTAALSGGIGGVTGIVGIALAFGLSIVAMAYCIGNVSGCHINPAVSFAMLLSKRMSGKDFVGYVIAQVLGAILASAILMAIINSADLGGVAATGLGQDGFGEASAVGLSMGGAFLVEVILTFVFVMTVLGVTASEKMGSVAGIVIGLTLAFVHIMGIPLTGTSVNPARSLAPAIFMGGQALEQVWLFIAAPLLGAAVAAFVWVFLVKSKKEQLA
ncbi:MIP family channel protein [Christensenella tenuis]|uniref:MIP family channel protein n=1 Tax=Christensenella tenuis TaxID=2763033 RepID=A0ABR7EF05_9FIRM|nr:MIP family channel protein [Christensenella tenuis]MBC5648331.1 MIP family channel protein [Christensenella tenuis]